MTTAISHHSQIANASNHRGFSHVNRGTTRRSYKKRMCTTIAFDIHHMTDFVRYLACRKLDTTGLLQFNVQPESYRAWRRSFQRGHDFTHSEEMDLLIKWFGKKSVVHAKRIRVVHLNHLERGLRMILGKHYECYGFPERIKCALFKWPDDFPMMSNKEPSKQREFSKLLMGLQTVKEDGNLPRYSSSIYPIQQKTSLQPARAVAVIQTTTLCSSSLFNIYRVCKSAS